MNVVLYERISTRDQQCELQHRELTEFCARHGWQIVATYQDTISGATASRPALDQMMEAARQHKFDAVLVWKLDRLGRSVINLVDLVKRLDSYGVRFLATQQGIDTDKSNPTSRLLLHILASVAEFERELINERVAAGVKNAQAKGVRFGRPTRVVDTLRIAEMHAGGMSLERIAGELGCAKTTVFRRLKGAGV